MNIDYEYYRIFYYAAKYKNLTRAAHVLHNSQPNISRTIKLLESALGCCLLIRSNRGITLTPEGERLYTHVKAAVEQLRSAENEILASASMQDGCVTVGATETALHMLLLPVLRQFRKDHPKIRIRLLNHLTTQAVDSVKRGEVDLAVVVSPPDIEKPLSARSLFCFRDILVGGPSYRVFREKPVTLGELAAHPLICLGEGTMTFRTYEDFYRRHGLTLYPELQAAATDQILPMIKNDLGIGYVPEIFARDALDKGEVFRLSLTDQLPLREICLIENEQYPLTVAARELRTLLITHKI